MSIKTGRMTQFRQTVEGRRLTPALLVVKLGQQLYHRNWQNNLAMALGIQYYVIWKIDHTAMLGKEHPEYHIHEKRALVVLRMLRQHLLPMIDDINDMLAPGATGSYLLGEAALQGSIAVRRLRQDDEEEG